MSIIICSHPLQERRREGSRNTDHRTIYIAFSRELCENVPSFGPPRLLFSLFSVCQEGAIAEGSATILISDPSPNVIFCCLSYSFLNLNHKPIEIIFCTFNHFLFDIASISNNVGLSTKQLVAHGGLKERKCMCTQVSSIS